MNNALDMCLPNVRLGCPVRWPLPLWPVSPVLRHDAHRKEEGTSGCQLPRITELDFRQILVSSAPQLPLKPSPTGHGAPQLESAPVLFGAYLDFIPSPLLLSEGVWFLQDSNAMWHPISQSLPFVPTSLAQPPHASTLCRITRVVVHITSVSGSGNNVSNTHRSPITGDTTHPSARSSLTSTAVTGDSSNEFAHWKREGIWNSKWEQQGRAGSGGIAQGGAGGSRNGKWGADALAIIQVRAGQLRPSS